MPPKIRRERPDRLEQVVTMLAEGQISLEKTVAELATETRRGFDQVAAQFEVIGKRMAETDEKIRQMSRENSQRSREMDDRVDKLVLAIAKLIDKTDLRA